MRDWLTAGVACVAVVAFCLRLWYRWQKKQEGARLAQAIATADVEELSILLSERLDLRLVSEWFGNPALILAVPCHGALELLLAHGVDVDERGVGWMTALMHAAAAGDHYACEVLIAHGADPDARDLFGRTAAWWAEQHGHQALR